MLNKSFIKNIQGEVIGKVVIVILAVMLAATATTFISRAFSDTSRDASNEIFTDIGVDQSDSGDIENVSDESDEDGSSSDPYVVVIDSDGNEHQVGSGYDPTGENYEDSEEWVSSRPIFEGTREEVAEKEWKYYYPEEPDKYYDFSEWDPETGGVSFKPSGDEEVGGYVYIPEMVEKDDDWNFITRVDNNAFRNDTDLLAISLPGTIREIGVGAFAGAENLHLVEFRGQIQAEELMLPELNFIGNHAFGDTSSLRHLYIAGEPEYVGNQTFSNSPNLTLYFEMENQGPFAQGNSTYNGKEDWHSGWEGALDPNAQVEWGVSKEEFQAILENEE